MLFEVSWIYRKKTRYIKTVHYTLPLYRHNTIIDEQSIYYWAMIHTYIVKNLSLIALRIFLYINRASNSKPKLERRWQMKQFVEFQMPHFYSLIPRFQHFGNISIPTHEWSIRKSFVRGTFRRIIYVILLQWPSDVKLLLSFSLSHAGRVAGAWPIFSSSFSLTGLPRKSQRNKGWIQYFEQWHLTYPLPLC